MSGSSFAQARFRATCLFARDVAAAWCRDVIHVRDDALEDLAMPIAEQLVRGVNPRTMDKWLQANLPDIGTFSRADLRALAEALVSGKTDKLPTFRG